MSDVAAPQAGLPTFVWRSITCQMTSYFVIGWLASSAFNYRELFATGGSPAGTSWQYMRGFDSAWVPAGPILQCIRGCLFGVVLWPLRRAWLDQPRGWLRLWLLFVGLAILGPTAAAPGSLEGMIYTNLSWSDHLLGWPEMGAQTLLFSLILQRWYRCPSRWWNRSMIAAVAIVCVLCTLGVLAILYPQAFQS